MSPKWLAGLGRNAGECESLERVVALGRELGSRASRRRESRARVASCGPPVPGRRRESLARVVDVGRRS